MRYVWIGLAVLVVPGGLLLLAIAVGKWFAVRSQEPTIHPLSPDQYRYTGHDEALAVRTLVKRAEADAIRRRARRLETEGEARIRLRRVH